MSELVMANAGERRLTALEFQELASVPAAVEWFANIRNPRTRRAYQADLREFCSFVDLAGAEEFRVVNRAHVLAWRAQLERRALSGATIRRKLATLASPFDYLLDNNALAGGNQVHGVARPPVETNEGKTPALGGDQTKRLLDAPDDESLQGVRDRAILAVLLYQGLRREELSLLQTGDLQERRGVKHLRIHGKGGKIRYLPLHPVAAERIYVYLVRDGDRAQTPGALFRSLRGKTSGTGITGKGVYGVVSKWASAAQIHVDGLGVHGLRATAATNALEHDADIAKVQIWLGHADRKSVV